MILSGETARPIPLNSAYIINSLHYTEQLTQPLYSYVVKIILIYLTARLGETSYETNYNTKVPYKD